MLRDFTQVRLLPCIPLYVVLCLQPCSLLFVHISSSPRYARLAQSLIVSAIVLTLSPKKRTNPWSNRKGALKGPSRGLLECRASTTAPHTPPSPDGPPLHLHVGSDTSVRVCRLHTGVPPLSGELLRLLFLLRVCVCMHR